MASVRSWLQVKPWSFGIKSWPAEHVYLKRRVAVKTLRDPRPNGQEIEQFRTEAERASKLDHPHIVRVHDFGFDQNGDPFLVMDLV